MRHLILDLDGVLRVWDPHIMTAAEARAGIPLGSLAAAAFEPGLLSQVTTGPISDEDWRRLVTEQLRSLYGTSAALAVDEWSLPHGVVNEAVRSLVASRRDRFETVSILSNATSRLDRDLEVLGLTTTVDHVFNTSALGSPSPT